MARGAGYYSPNAAMLLLRHLVTRRDNDDEYITALGEAGELLTGAFLSGQLSVRSQAHIAMMAASQAGVDLMPDEDE